MLLEGQKKQNLNKYTFTPKLHQLIDIAVKAGCFN